MEHVQVGRNEPHDHHHQHDRHRIAVPILRYLINFYSALGIPLQDYSQHSNWRTICYLAFDMIKNITIAAILLYYVFADDIYRSAILLNIMEIYKPFFAKVLMITFFGLSRFDTIFNMYYIVFGARIVRELDCEPFRAAFRSAADLRLKIMVTVAMNGTYIYTHYNHFRVFFLDNADIAKLTSELPVLYANFMHTNFPVNLALYQQYATGRALSQIECELRERHAACRIAGKRLGKTEICHYLERLRAIVRINVRINRLLTVPLMLFVALYISNVVNMTCVFLLIYVIFESAYFSFFGFPLLTIVYLVTIATFNGKNCTGRSSL